MKIIKINPQIFSVILQQSAEMPDEGKMGSFESLLHFRLYGALIQTSAFTYDKVFMSV